MLEQRLKLSAAERREKHKIVLRDTAALCTLAGLVVVLSFVTYGLFHSFMAHRQMLEERWRARGEAALAADRPQVALNDLHSALAYAPDDRGLQIELATALAASGRTQEAQVYFTTLLESAPGSGPITLQLARLAIRQNNAQAAVEHYQLAIDGAWNGDAFTRRRELRIELARFLISQGRFAEARSLLLITSGNGPDNYGLQLMLGALLEQANDAADAQDVYHKAALHKATRLSALEGEAHAAATLGRYSQARTLLQQVTEEAGFAHQPQATRDAVHAALDTANGVLAMYPADSLPPRERASRIAKAAALAQARLLACPADAAGDANTAPGTADGANTAGNSDAPTRAEQRARLLANLGTHLRSLNPLASKPEAVPAPVETTDPLAALAARWTTMPTGALLQQQLMADPQFARNTLLLAYATERAASTACGAPAGADALLTRIAEAPEQIEAQP